MMRQGFVQEKIADLTNGNQLPPLNTLPQWTRVNTLDKARYPKPFVKDRLLHPDMKSNEDNEIDLSEMNPAQRIQYLERSLLFLKQQHQDVLKSLHEEVDGLKKENKDLQFKMVMNQRNQGRITSTVTKDSHGDSSGFMDGTDADGQTDREEKLDEVKIIFLEEEIKELKHALRETRNRNTYLAQVVEQLEEQKKRYQSTIDSLKFQLAQGKSQAAEAGAGGDSQHPTPAGGPSPLTQLQAGRPLTLQECHAIIRHLQQVNEQQAHELERLKSDLRDVLYSHKWTPDAYLLAKAYVAEDDAKEQQQQQQDPSGSKSALPRIPLKNPSRKLPDIAYIQRDNVMLPALKQTVSNKATERRKRTQILQKARMNKEVHP